jgi:hypothetical protein
MTLKIDKTEAYLKNISEKTDSIENYAYVHTKQLEDLIAIESEKVEELKAMNQRQAKENKFNFPFVLSGTVFGYSGLHIMMYGVEDFKQKLITIFDSTIGFFV